MLGIGHNLSCWGSALTENCQVRALSSGLVHQQVSNSTDSSYLLPRRSLLVRYKGKNNKQPWHQVPWPYYCQYPTLFQTLVRLQQVNIVKGIWKRMENPKQGGHFTGSEEAKVVEVHSIHDILLLASCSKLCHLVDKRRFQSVLHPPLFVESLASFLFLDQMLNLLQFLLSFPHGFGNIDSRHITLGVGSSRSSRETSRIESSSDSWSTPTSLSHSYRFSKCGDMCWCGLW